MPGFYIGRANLGEPQPFWHRAIITNNRMTAAGDSQSNEINRGEEIYPRRQHCSPNPLNNSHPVARELAPAGLQSSPNPLNNSHPVARELAPAGLQSSPNHPEKLLQTKPQSQFKPQAQTHLVPIFRPNPSPVYPPAANRPPGYPTLRHCLQLRQNPPACAPCLWALSFSCHCPSVVGFSSPRLCQ